MVNGWLDIQRVVLERLHLTPAAERKREDFRGLRKSLGYTLSVVTAAAPQEGFALMRDCAGWGDADIAWVLRENLKKRRLAKFADHSGELTHLLDAESQLYLYTFIFSILPLKSYTPTLPF